MEKEPIKKELSKKLSKQIQLSEEQKQEMLTRLAQSIVKTREDFLTYLKVSDQLRKELREDPEHQKLRREIDALNQMTMSGEYFNGTQGETTTPVTPNVIDAEYDENTGHYV